VLDQHTLAVRFADDDPLVVARLSGGAGTVNLSVNGQPAVSTEDPEFATDFKPIVMSSTSMTFQRPGAVVVHLPRRSA
jgi:hypothetical protein